jgi:hypothetical protein
MRCYEAKPDPGLTALREGMRFRHVLNVLQVLIACLLMGGRSRALISHVIDPPVLPKLILATGEASIVRAMDSCRLKLNCTIKSALSLPIAV